ncbi:MAG: hypothetical protein V4637_09435 [Pseudomonadota bacterium]
MATAGIIAGEQIERSFEAPPLQTIVLTPPQRVRAKQIASVS